MYEKLTIIIQKYAHLKKLQVFEVIMHLSLSQTACNVCTLEQMKYGNCDVYVTMLEFMSLSN